MLEPMSIKNTLPQPNLSDIKPARRGPTAAPNFE